MASLKKRQYVALVVDASSSMNPFRQQVVDAFNNTLETLKVQAAKTKIETFVSFHTFNLNSANTVIQPTNVSSVTPITLGNYQPYGGTPMYDGIGEAIRVLEGQMEGKNMSYLIITMTDGEENASRQYTNEQIRKRMEAKLNGGKWTFAYQVPYGYRAHLVKLLGLEDGNVMQWEQTNAGFREATVSTQSGIANYMSMKHAAGGAAIRSSTFYSSVTTDLGKVTTKQVTKVLDDVSNKFKAITVEKEAVVKDLVEAKLGRSYVIGCAFYQLMKPEKVQANKQVLLQEKGKKAVWGGDEARQLIGLEQGKPAKVTPGNHSNYDIFIQSTSTNRKLPRGTKLLVDTTLTTNLTPTWAPDPTKAPKP